MYANRNSEKSVKWRRNALQTDPLFRVIIRLKNQIRKKVRHAIVGHIPLAVYREHLALAKAAKKLVRKRLLDPATALRLLELRWKKIRSIYLTKTVNAPPPKPRVIKPKVSDEIRRRNMLIFEANMRRAEIKKQARKEWEEARAKWEKKWRPLLGKTRSSKSNRHKREHLMRHTRCSTDSALTIQLRIIRIGPCKCFWCGTYLPKGGHADHIIPIAKGGSHTSDNVCAACPTCNLKKGALDHSDIGLQPALF